MRFFLPSATGPIQAERVHKRIADRLIELGIELGYVIAPHRIYQITFKREGQLISETVGRSSYNDETVKNDIGYFICTYSRGAVWGDPIVARYGQVESAIFFDEATVNLNMPG